MASTVLVETFEAGRGVAVFMREPHAINTQIVALGVDAYLKMLLTDNFVHTDLHPGRRLRLLGWWGRAAASRCLVPVAVGPCSTDALVHSVGASWAAGAATEGSLLGVCIRTPH